MGFFDFLKNNSEKRNLSNVASEDDYNFLNSSMSYNNYSAYKSSSNGMKLSAVYCATNLISNTIASLPINLFSVDEKGFKKINYESDLYKLLNYQPSKNFSRFNFFKNIITSIILKGNGFALIIKSGNKIKEVKYIHPDNVTVIYDNKTDSIKYKIIGYNKEFNSSDVLHFFMYSQNGYFGDSVITNAINTIKNATDAETFAGAFYKSGAATSGLLKTTGPITKDQIQQLKSSWSTAFNSSDTLGVVVLPNGVDYTPISINSRDAQLIESRNLNISEIARFFNISPVKLFDLSNSSYSSLEQTQLSYLQDTINPYLQMIENELNRKLFNFDISNIIKFDVAELLSTDKKASAEYYRILLQNGIMTTNEVRKSLNLNDVADGDELLMQLNMSTLSNIKGGVNLKNNNK